MAFKPRIFISSTFGDNQKVRERIKKHFIELGAEPLLYESNLTPSTKPMTYRNDILEADFVILIMKDNYGTETDWGISGTHEEYQIAKENQIPIHVYLTPNTSKDNALVNELIADQVSYYYFKTDNELFKRLKETSFIIAEEIILRQIVQKKIPHYQARQISYNADYKRAVDLIHSIETMKKYHNNFGIDYLTTTIFSAFTEPIIYYAGSQEHLFINWKLNEVLNEMLKIAQEYTGKHTLDYTSIPGTFRKLDDGLSAEILISNVSYYKNTEFSFEDYNKLLENFFDKYEYFKNLIKEIKLLSDIN